MPFKAVNHSRRTKRPWIIKGLIREGQVVTIASECNCGKTPLMKDWAVAIAAGIDWCGHETTQRPVIMVDMESDDGQFYENIVDIANRRGLGDRELPIEIYLKKGELDDPLIIEMQEVEAKKDITDKMKWLEAKMALHPNAVVIIDPITMLFNIDKNKGTSVNAFFKLFRDLQLKYRASTFIFIYNLRKEDPRREKSSLIDNPHGWLQDISGSMDLQNRSDTRFGLAFMIPGDREPIVLNGLVRGEVMEPIVLEGEWNEVEGEPRGAGFKRVAPNTLDKELVLGKRMKQHWEVLPEQFTSADINAICSRATGFRLRTRAIALGFLRETALGMFQKIG